MSSTVSSPIARGKRVAVWRPSGPGQFEEVYEDTEEDVPQLGLEKRELFVSAAKALSSAKATASSKERLVPILILITCINTHLHTHTHAHIHTQSHTHTYVPEYFTSAKIPHTVRQLPRVLCVASSLCHAYPATLRHKIVLSRINFGELCCSFELTLVNRGVLRH